MLARVALVWRTLMAHYRQHPAQGIFLLAGLSLGVAILLGTLIVGHAAKTAFTKAEQTINSNIIGNIVPVSGRQTLPQQLYVNLRRSGFTHLLPQVEGRIQLQDNRFAHLKGVDAFALLQNTSGQSAQAANDSQNSLSLLDFSFEPYQLLVANSLASTYQLQQGDRLTLADGQSLPSVHIVSDKLGSGYSLLCDINCAQKILALEDELTSIALTRQPQQWDLLKAALPPYARLVLSDKNAQNQALSEAFFLNMTAVSLLAFLVGCFIAFNAVRFSVLQRLPLVQQLRITGVTFKEVASALMLELLSWAVLASIAGSLLGWLIADALLPGVGLTVTRLFQNKNLLTLPDIAQWWYLALALSLIATLVAVAQPFWQLAKHQPMQRTPTKTHSKTGVLAVTILAVGCLLTGFEHSQWLGFGVTFAWFIGGALLVPYLVVRLYSVLHKTDWVQRSPKRQWLVADGQHNQARLSVAMMAFTVSIAAGIGVATMVSSFQLALEDYLNQVLAEDLYLQPHHRQADSIYQYLNQHNDVELAYRFYHTTTDITKDHQSFVSFVRGLSDHPIRQNSISLEHQTADIWQKLHNREGIVINQTLAFQQQLQVGNRVTIKHNLKPVEVTVLGVYHSYGSTVASMLIDQDWLTTLWPKVETTQIGVFVKPHKDSEHLVNQLKSQFGLKSHQVVKPQTVKSLALKIFTQTFEATQLLSLLTLLIAAIGIYCACYAAQIAQQKQLTLLKILGLEHKDIVRLCSAGLMFNAVVASLVAIPLGLMIAWASVHIVLQYSFGWYFDIVINTKTIATIVVTALFVALISGVIPLYKLGRQTALTAFRESM